MRTMTIAVLRVLERMLFALVRWQIAGRLRAIETSEARGSVPRVRSRWLLTFTWWLAARVRFAHAALRFRAPH